MSVRSGCRCARWTALSLAILLTVAGSAWGEKRVVAVGDVQGSYSRLVTILVKSGLLDAGAHWNGGSQVLVQTGNLIGRGGTVRPVLDLMIRLQAEASAQGGRVIVLIGNHEAMALLGLENDVNPRVYEEFAGRGSKRALGRAYAQRKEAWQRRVREQGASAVPPIAEKKAWLAAHPRGWVEYREAVRPTGVYGSWLRTLPAVAIVANTLFVHGGLGPAVDGLSTDEINQRVAGELTTFLEGRAAMEAARLVPPHASLEEVMLGARAALTREGGSPNPGRLHSLLEQVLQARTWFLLSPGGPLSYHGQGEATDAEVAARTLTTLDALGVQRLVAGRTSSQDGRIHVRFGGRAFLIDTGVPSEGQRNGRPSALEIRDDTVTAIYPEGRVHLVGPEGPSRVTGLGGHPDILDAGGRSLSGVSDDRIIDVLRTGRVVQYRQLGRGINKNYKLLLEKDGMRIHAAYRIVDQEAKLPVGSDVEMRRKYGGSAMDRAIYEAAAYELSRILGIDRVTPTAERRVDEIRFRSRQTPRSTVQLWLERVTGDRDRRRRGVVPPDAEYEHQQLQTMYLFDNIIGNIDRTQENLLFDRNWKLWLIDHTRSFIKSATLVNPDQPTQCERRVWQCLTSLNEQEVRRRLEPYLEKTEINFVLVRWHKMVEVLQARMDAE
ncbi:MAG: metallophosphoesterase, partial [Acidobacteria bacterium]|nr:metallophosphoesterase [Acidobacteriota bacterium]